MKKKKWWKGNSFFKKERKERKLNLHFPIVGFWIRK